jgi:hypothetical protein
MTYLAQGEQLDGSTSLPQDGRNEFWTFDAVQERLIEAMRLWWRSPGGGRWPFAGDAPWHLMTRRTRIEAGDFKGRELQLREQADDAEEAKRWEGRDRKGPLSRDEVALRDEATEWLLWVPERDRRLVIIALTQLAAGHANPSWMKIKTMVGVEFGADGLRKRYSRAVSGVAQRLNGSVIPTNG